MDSIKKIIFYNFFLTSTLIGVLLGLILGTTLKPYTINDEVKELLSYPGEIFIRCLQSMIIPVVFFSLLVGSASLEAKSNGKIAGRTLLYFLTTSVFNSLLGICLVALIQPGSSFLSLSPNETLLNTDLIKMDRKNTVLDNFLDLGRNIVPNNLFSALFQQSSTLYYRENVDGNSTSRLLKKLIIRSGTNTLGVMSFAIFFGTAISLVGAKAKIFLDVAKSIDEVTMKMISIAIWLTPIGVASIITTKILEVTNILETTGQLGMFILTVTIGIFLNQWIFSQLIYFIILKKNPFKFYVGILPAIMTAFASASSAATIPITLKCLDEKLKIDTRISRFVVPIGATVNMDGTALFVSVASIFIAQMNNIPLGIGDYMSVCLTATAVSVATATAPSASLYLMFIILNAINVPTRDVGLLLTIDWFMDRMRTTNNIMGDAYATAIVQHFSKKELESQHIEKAADSDAKENEKVIPKDLSSI